MAFSDLEKYYTNVKNSYIRVLDMLKEFDKEHKQGTIEDSAFLEFKANVDKITQQYESLAYFFMLWSKPTEHEKDVSKNWEEKHKSIYNYLKRRHPDKYIKDNECIIEEIEKFLESREKDVK